MSDDSRAFKYGMTP